MAAFDPARPRVSRETRLLLATVIVSVSVLWVLARLRFPEPSAAPATIPQVLTQLLPAPGFDDLAATVARVGPRLTTSLVAIPRPLTSAGPAAAVQALRIRDALAVAVLLPADAGDAPDVAGIVRRDRATGLTLIQVDGAGLFPIDVATLRESEFPRYLLISGAGPRGPVIRPLFLAAVAEVSSAAWSGPVWALARQADVEPGAFVFTVDGTLAGVVSTLDGAPVLVPGASVFAAAQQLERAEQAAPGTIAIDVQPVTPAVTAATGATSGVVVAGVEAAGATARELAVLDVIEAVDGEVVATLEHWRTRTARLGAGQTLRLRVRRAGVTRDVTVAAAAPAILPPAAALTLRPIARLGAEVVRVASGSDPARAGLAAGDIITAVGGTEAPTPAQVLRAFADAPPGRPLLVAVARRGTHLVLGVEKRQPE